MSVGSPKAEPQVVTAAAGAADQSTQTPAQSSTQTGSTETVPFHIEDLIVSHSDVGHQGWQYPPYQKGSATWQAAAQRRHSHWRRTNAVLGCASVDLSGPHEPTPMPGAKLGQQPANY